MSRQQRRHQERQERKQDRNEAFGGGTWEIWKIYPNGQQELLAEALHQHQAQKLGEHFRVGCMPGETITLRTGWVADF